MVDVANGRIGIGTASPGNFALDVTGDTRITGDLTVEGTTTTVDSQNLSIEDNMIVLNSSGSIGHNAGVMIQRGAAGNNAVMYWDESIDKFKFGTTTADGSTTDDFASTLAKLQIGEPAADSDASTKKYVDDKITSGLATINIKKIRDGVSTLTDVVVEDTETNPGNPSTVKVTVDGNNSHTYYNNRSEFHDLRIYDSTIQTTVSTGDLTLSAPGTGSVIIDDNLHIKPTPHPDDALVDPGAPTEGLKLYSKAPGIGKTGLFYVNSSNVRDEILSKNRSLLLSMIF